MSEMTKEDAFREGLARVRAAGIPAKGHDIAVLAAHRVFIARCEGKDLDPRFPVQGPAYAMNMILDAYAMGGEK